MSIVKLTAIKCTPSTKTGFILKLQNKELKQEQTAFGVVTQSTQKTYYMKVGSMIAIGTTAELDISKFKVTPMPYTIPASPAVGIEGQPGYKPATQAETVYLDWLFL